jgi:hypothetical protein
MDAYMKWILEKMEFRKRGRKKYGKLMKYLNNTEYEFKTLLDENRLSDALNMRNNFLEEYFGGSYNKYDSTIVAACPNIIVFGPHRCSILEMLAALSIRCEIEMTGEPGCDVLGRMFWIAIDNSGLGKFSDDKFDGQFVKKTVNEMTNFDIFPFHRPGIDKNRVDLWYAMQLWITENL